MSKFHPADLGAHVIDSLIQRNHIQPQLIDDVIIGCVSQIGAQGANLGRMVVLSSRLLPITVPGTTVDRQCGSSQQAIHFAAQAVMSGTQDVVIAGGVEVMSLVPIGSNVMDGLQNGRGDPMSDGIRKKYPEVAQFSQFEGAELLAKKYNITREDMEKFAVASHTRAAAATKQGRFKNEIIPVPLPADAEGGKPARVFDTDEGIRPATNLEGLTKLKTLAPDGRITAALSSQITDGASAVLICNEAGLKKLGLRPRAKIVSLALSGTDPVIMLEGPIPATQRALKQIGKTIEDIDLYEVNEAFASVPLAWLKGVKGDFNKLNVNGGAMALGHPLGATGTKLMGTLVNELERRGNSYGVLSICEGGGTANATVIQIIPKSKL